MEQYKERLIKRAIRTERQVHQDCDFINSPDFYELLANNKQLLRNQKIAIKLYLNVLKQDKPTIRTTSIKDVIF